MVSHHLQDKIEALFGDEIENYQKKDGKQHESAVEELRWILFEAEDSEPNPDDLIAIFDAVFARLGDLDISDAEIGAAFKDSEASVETAKALANAANNGDTPNDES
jgi:hypothetical protein